MKLYMVGPNVVRFRIWNLLTPVSGHYTFFYNLDTRKYVMCQHGDYQSLTSYQKVAATPRFPTPKEASGLRRCIADRLRTAYHYGDGRNHPPLLKSSKAPFCGGYYVWPVNHLNHDDAEETKMTEQALEMLK